MKFDQLIEYNTINAFLQNSYTKCDAEASSRPVHKKSKFSVFLDQKHEWNVIKFVFNVCPSRGLPKYVKTKVMITCFWLIKLFQKIRRDLESHYLESPYLIIFCMIVEEKHFSYFILFLDILGNICVVISRCPVCDVINLEIIIAFLFSRFSTKPKSLYKIAIISSTKKAFNMK